MGQIDNAKAKNLHVPVMVNEVIGYLPKKSGLSIIDCTLGTGGHTFAFLENVKDSTVLSTDLDEDQIDRVFDQATEKGFTPEEHTPGIWGWTLQGPNKNRLFLVKSNFMLISEIAKMVGIQNCDLILFDLGFSTYQLDTSKRGFSYTSDEQILDQRFNTTEGHRAMDILNVLSRKDIVKLLEDFGEEKYAEDIADAIVRSRKREPIETTTQLITLIRKTVGERYERGKHPAMRTFQALRISVNNELVSLKSALPQALDLIAGVKGKLLIITFNSLERKLIDEYFKVNKEYEIIKKHKPTLSEVAKNTRSHNAVLYVIGKSKK